MSNKDSMSDVSLKNRGFIYIKIFRRFHLKVFDRDHDISNSTSRKQCTLSW